MTAPDTSTPLPPANPEPTPDELAALDALANRLIGTGEAMNPTDLRGAAVALALGTADAMLHVPDRILAGNVVHRAVTAGKLAELAAAYDRLTGGV